MGVIELVPPFQRKQGLSSILFPFSPTLPKSQKAKEQFLISNISTDLLKFKMETLKSIVAAISRENWITSIDVKDVMTDGNFLQYLAQILLN